MRVNANGSDDGNDGNDGNGWFRERVRFIGMIAAAVAAVVVFAWASQARQDDRIADNRRDVAVLEAGLEARLKAIEGQLVDIQADVKALLGKDKE